MSKAYEQADKIQEQMTKDLEILGFDVQMPPEHIRLERKVSILNYLRTIRSTCEVLEPMITEYRELTPQGLKVVQ